MSKLFEVKKDCEVSTDDFWYDCTDGGYLNPEDILVHENDIAMVKHAIEIVKKFQDSCEEQIEDFYR